jgi:hypothetical protein
MRGLAVERLLFNRDRFDHKAAYGKVRSVQKNLNDLRHAFPSHAEKLEKAFLAAGEIVAELAIGGAYRSLAFRPFGERVSPRVARPFR